MIPNQVAAVVLAVLAVGAGAVGAAQVSGPLQAVLADLPRAADEAETRAINISVDGNVTAGETVTLTATLDGEPVPHAPVEVDGEAVGKTDADGTIDVTVPEGDEFEVEIEPEYEGSTTVPLADEEADDGEQDEDGAEADDEESLDLAISDNVTAGENVTVTATHNGTAVAGADVEVNGEHVGTTDANGTVEVTVPDADEFEVEASFEEKGKLKVPLEGEVADEDVDDDEADDELEVVVEGNVSAGETVVVAVTQDGTPVENATVTLDDEVVGITDEDGTVAVTIPSDAEEIEFEVEAGDAEGEYEAEHGASTEESDG